MAEGKFVSYLRVSTDRQGKSGLGLEAQRKAVTDYLDGGNWQLLAQYVEVESGSSNNRPALAVALELCRKENATLLIARLDRLSRNVTFLSTLLDKGVDFVAVDNPNVTPMVTRILAAVAQEERELISRRTSAALQAAKARGKKLGWAIPERREEQRLACLKGAKKNMERAKRFKANTLPIIADIRKAGVTSLRGIADTLNKRGVATRRGGQWYAATVRNIEHRA